MHRNSIATYIGHHAMLEYFAAAENTSTAEQFTKLTHRAVLPCGMPPSEPPADDKFDAAKKAVT
jgi:hypothetical protein